MQTSTIRQKLHQYIDNSDEKLLKLMFALAKEYNDDDLEYVLRQKISKHLMNAGKNV